MFSDKVNVEFDSKDSENAAIIKEFKANGLIKTNHNGIFNHYKDSFSGRDLVNWLIVNKTMERRNAIQSASNMLNEHLFHHVKYAHKFEDDPGIYYRLLEDEHTNALNSGPTPQKEPIPGRL